MLGLKHTTVKLVPHSCEWQHLFQNEVFDIRHTLNNQCLWIEHVGSTALPGIFAKPILDMFVACDDVSDALKYVEPLAVLGYELVTDGEHYKLFIKGSEEARTHHLTFTNPEGNYWTETIQFRNYLLEHPQVAKDYEVEKMKLAKQYPSSRRNYSLNKARFIQTVLRKLNKEALQTNRPECSDVPEAIAVIPSDIKEFFENKKDFPFLQSEFQHNAKTDSPIGLINKTQ